MKEYLILLEKGIKNILRGENFVKEKDKENAYKEYKQAEQSLGQALVLASNANDLEVVDDLQGLLFFVSIEIDGFELELSDQMLY